MPMMKNPLVRIKGKLDTGREKWNWRYRNINYPKWKKIKKNIRELYGNIKQPSKYVTGPFEGGGEEVKKNSFQISEIWRKLQTQKSKMLNKSPTQENMNKLFLTFSYWWYCWHEHACSCTCLSTYIHVHTCSQKHCYQQLKERNNPNAHQWMNRWTNLVYIYMQRNIYSYIQRKNMLIHE